MIKKYLIYILVCTLVFPLGLTAKDKHGADLLVETLDGKQVRGELIAVRDASLLLLERETGADVSVDIGDISVISIVRKSKTWSGVGFGFLVGAGLGAIASIPAVDADPDYGSSYYFVPWLPTVIYVAIGGLVGALGGGIIGANPRDKTIQIEGESQEEVNLVLENLRSKARVTDYN